MVSKGQLVVVVTVAAILIGSGALVDFSYSPPSDDPEKLSIVASFYPLAYMAQEIGGEKVDVSTLIPYNNEVHTWSPSPSDILRANTADILLYNGAGLDTWMETSLLPSIDASNKLIVETTHGIKLLENEEGSGAARLFVVDNDNNRTLVYDLDRDHTALLRSLPVKMNVVAPYSGHFDSPVAVETPSGYVHLYIPDTDKVTVLDTGLHGDHFHDVEVVTQISAGKPIHYAVSQDSAWVAFTEDEAKKTLIINVSAPGNYLRPDNGGASSTSHATLVFDGRGMLFSADMKTTNGSNLQVLYPNNGTTSYVGAGGVSPHGGFYSSATDKVYLNCADGIAVLGSSGIESMIPYTHHGPILKRSWLSNNGTWLISYVANASAGLEYDSIVAYDLVTGHLVREIDVNVTQMKLATYGWGNSEYYVEDDIVALADPEMGKVHLISMESGEVTSVGLNGTYPQPLRVTIDEGSGMIWAVSGSGRAYRIHAHDAEVEAEYDLDADLGNNLIVAVVSVDTGHEHEEGSDHEHDHDHGLCDPHTWISPYIAKQQAQNIYQAIVQKDPGNATYYGQRMNILLDRFEQLDDEFISGLLETEREQVFVAHGAFGYLAGRYGFEQRSVIGISGDEQPSPSTIAALVDMMVSSQTYFVYLDPVFSDAYVNTLKSNVESVSGHSVTVLKLYLMTGPVDGKDYFQQMESNLMALKQGLGAT